MGTFLYLDFLASYQFLVEPFSFTSTVKSLYTTSYHIIPTKRYAPQPAYPWRTFVRCRQFRIIPLKRRPIKPYGAKLVSRSQTWVATPGDYCW